MAKLVKKVYSKALFDTAISVDKLDLIYEEVKLLRDIFKNDESIDKLLVSPKISKEEKINTVKSIFEDRISKELVGLFIKVIEKNRQTELNEIFDDYIFMVKEYKNIGIVYVTSAIELSDEVKKAIESRIIETSKYKVLEMNFNIDKNILGGLIIRINNRVFDSSVSKKLSNIKKELLNTKIG